jgi:hypothetical protein
MRGVPAFQVLGKPFGAGTEAFGKDDNRYISPSETLDIRREQQLRQAVWALGGNTETAAGRELANDFMGCPQHGSRLCETKELSGPNPGLHRGTILTQLGQGKEVACDTRELFSMRDRDKGTVNHSSDGSREPGIGAKVPDGATQRHQLF